MKIIGLTGQTGAGKSTIANILREKGFCVIDGDLAARSVAQPGSPVLKKLSEVFGSDVVFADGTLNRRLLASRAFSLPENTLKLNEITHPAITELIFDEIAKAAQDGFSVFFVDAAALLECKELCGKCDLIVSVTAPLSERLARILARDSISEEEALTRINAQPDEKYYIDRSNLVLVNSPPQTPDSEAARLISFVTGGKTQ